VNPAPAFNSARAFDQTTGIMQRNIFSQAEDSDDYATNLDLTGKFNLGFTKHNVLLGFDFYRSFETYSIQGLWITPAPRTSYQYF
jgi:iron complex outermembrane recepter protein